MKVHDLSMYGSHLPFLAKIIELSYEDPDWRNKPLLDLGMGLSTILFHMMTKERRRKVVSYESDYEWYKANLQYQTEWHEIRYVKDFADADIEDVFWGVAFVDHAPAKQRIKEIKRLTRNVDYLVIHDTEPESDRFFKYRWIWKHFANKYDYTFCRPYTSVVSNTKPLIFVK